MFECIVHLKGWVIYMDLHQNSEQVLIEWNQFYNQQL